jgi:hypothetical protein
MRLSLFLVVLFFFISCSSTEEVVPEQLMDPEIFGKVLLDIQILEGMKTQRVLGTEKSAYADSTAYESIFSKYKVDRETFLETYSYYRSRPGEMAKIYELVLDSLSTLDVQVKKEYTEEKRFESDSLLKVREQIRDSISKNLLRK